MEDKINQLKEEVEIQFIEELIGRPLLQYEKQLIKLSSKPNVIQSHPYNAPYTPEAFLQGAKVSVLGLFPVRTTELRGYNISNIFIDELEKDFTKGEKS